MAEPERVGQTEEFARLVEEHRRLLEQINHTLEVSHG